MSTLKVNTLAPTTGTEIAITGSLNPTDVATTRTNLGAGAANGLATLDASSKIITGQLPAAIAGSLSYEGGHSAAGNTAPAVTLVAGHYWIITAAGDFDAKTWAIFDIAVTDGTNFIKISYGDLGFLSLIEAETFYNSRFNAKGGRQALVFDGLTGRVDIPGGAASLQQKDRVLTYVFETNAKQETFRQPYYVKSTSSNTTGSGLEIYAQGHSTILVVLLRQEGVNTGHYQANWNNVIDGMSHDITVTVDYSGADPIITGTKNGVSLGSPTIGVIKTGVFNDTTATNIRLGAATTPTNQFLRGSLGQFLVFNYAIPATTTDGIKGVAERYRDGRFLTSMDTGQLGVFYESDFSAGLDSWVLANGTGDGNISIGGEDATLRLTHADANISVNSYFRKNNITAPYKGQVVRVKFRGYIPSTNAVLSDFSTLDVRADVISERVDISGKPQDTWNQYDVVLAVGQDTVDRIVIRFAGAGNANGDVAYIKDFEIESLGATLALESEGIQAERGQWLDSSANKLHALQQETGTKPLLRLSTSITVVEGVDATGAVFLLGARNILTDDWTVESVEVFNDEAESADINVAFSNGTNHVNINATTTVAAGTSKTIQVTNGKPIGYNRIRVSGGSEDMRFILALKPRR